MRYLHDIKFIDLKRSKWDKKESDPAKGQYKFLHKEYINYNDKVHRPDWFVSWARYDPNSRPPLRDMLDWKYKYGYVEVNVNTDNWIWPEPLPPDENGNYVYRDVILMKRPLIDELEDRVKAKEESEDAAKDAQDAWDAQMKQAGTYVPRDLIDDMASQESKVRRSR